MNQSPFRDNQRFFARVPYASELVVVNDREAWRTGLQDISEGGCSVFRPRDCDLVEGTLVRLFFVNGPGRSLAIDARVARDDERCLGFEYHEQQSIPPAPI